MLTHALSLGLYPFMIPSQSIDWFDWFDWFIISLIEHIDFLRGCFYAFVYDAVGCIECIKSFVNGGDNIWAYWKTPLVPPNITWVARIVDILYHTTSTYWFLFCSYFIPILFLFCSFFIQFSFHFCMAKFIFCWILYYTEQTSSCYSRIRFCR